MTVTTSIDVHIPTFKDLLDTGEIGPGQRNILFNFHLLADEITGQFVRISPIRGALDRQHTQFIAGGSQSGKTTYMSGNIGQAALLGTLFYIIDPHKALPEKSLAARVAAFSSYFILPPASSHEEIARVLEHATATRDALLRYESPYPGYRIMFVVDEVPALMAHQRSSNKEVKRLYLALALFMQSLGMQTAKFGMTGLYGSQFVTKEALGEIDFRDACMSQLILRLPPIQARAMGILGPDAVKTVPKLEKGHGYLMLSDAPEPLRVASGNVTPADLAQLAAMSPPSPLQNAYGNAYTPMEPAPQAAVGGELAAFPVSNETAIRLKRATETGNSIPDIVKRMRKRGMKHREIAPLVGLGGRKYELYQAMCREEGIDLVQPEDEPENDLSSD